MGDYTCIKLNLFLFVLLNHVGLFIFFTNILTCERFIYKLFIEKYYNYVNYSFFNDQIDINLSAQRILILILLTRISFSSNDILK